MGLSFKGMKGQQEFEVSQDHHGFSLVGFSAASSVQDLGLLPVPGREE